MPPRENPRLNTSIDSVYASGPLGRAHCVIHGNSNYKQTGLLQAWAALSLIQQAPRRVGLASAARRSGTASCSACCATVRAGARSDRHRPPLNMSLVGYLDKGASLGPDEPCLVAGDRTLSATRDVAGD